MNNDKSNIILDIKGLTAGYGGKPIIVDFNLQVISGDVVAITGPNGCGKSTLLKAIYQICKIISGDIIYKGESLIERTPEQIKGLGFAYFMQKNAIFSHLKVKENITLSLNGKSSIEMKTQMDQIVDIFPEISNWLNKTAGLLSGGQRQQLSLAMLLVQNADFWLLDEPTAGLDNDKTTMFVNTINNALIRKKTTVILVEHKTKVINELATKTIKF